MTTVLSAQHRLATYGSLAPGRPNHHQLDGLEGRWLRGAVRGRLVEQGWGACMGFPALLLDGAGDEVTVELFESEQLPAHWERLDAFEGAEYDRSLVRVSTDEGEVGAFIYVLATDA